jgi:hypothetical protein
MDQSSKQSNAIIEREQEMALERVIVSAVLVGYLLESATSDREIEVERLGRHCATQNVLYVIKNRLSGNETTDEQKRTLIDSVP